jgi:hypothetical protein
LEAEAGSDETADPIQDALDEEDFADVIRDAVQGALNRLARRRPAAKAVRIEIK